MTGWIHCPTCGRLMISTAWTCGNYCRWAELVPATEPTRVLAKPKTGALTSS
jgi:hypothetical protein